MQFSAKIMPNDWCSTFLIWEILGPPLFITPRQYRGRIQDSSLNDAPTLRGEVGEENLYMILPNFPKNCRKLRKCSAGERPPPDPPVSTLINDFCPRYPANQIKNIICAKNCLKMKKKLDCGGA